MTGSLYGSDFYHSQVGGSLRSARAVVPRVLAMLDGYEVRSVCDLGCGAGTWLLAFSEAGVAKIHGFDAGAVPRELLQIPASSFTAADLTKTLSRPERYDLALSLEVAEHIPEGFSDAFIDNLCALAPVALFSACPPTARHGTGHINEQAQSYWAKKFHLRGYRASTAIRDAIWADAHVQWFYRQNIVLYAHESIAGRLRVPYLSPEDLPLLDVRHPEFAELLIAESVNVRSVPGLLRMVVRRVLGI